jgi:hypothetical protein
MLTRCIEVALLKAFGQTESELSAVRIGRLLRSIFAEYAQKGEKVPVAFVFSRQDVTFETGKKKGAGITVVHVKSDDTYESATIHTTLAELDIWAAERTKDTDSFAMVFVRSAVGQSFYVHGQRIPLSEHPEPCMFTYGSHYDLEDALEEYRKSVAAHSECGDLSKCWPSKDRVLAVRPERYMRDSLWRFLKRRLHEHIVEREFNVGAKKPVDVMIDWQLDRRKAFVEVKWLGKTKSMHGKIRSYGPSRAVSGARQLSAHYVVRYLKENPDSNLLGYLAVFDAREDPSAPIVFPSNLDADVRLRLRNIWPIEPSTEP